MNIGNIGTGEIIHSDIYNTNSLEYLLEELCNPKVIITYQDIVNLLLKYFFGYINPESTNIKIPYKEIQELFGTAELLFYSSKSEINRGQKFSFSSSDKNVENQLKHISGNPYGLAMLCDAAPSVMIFKDIVEHIIHKNTPKDVYFGLDLGAGSGWLHLAQYIQARRNGFIGIENWGIEIKKEGALHANVLANKLQTGKIIQGDTTDINSYNRLPKDININHISNENIPTINVPMNGENDPFHQNNKTIFTQVLQGRINNNTTFFPRKINIEIKLGELQQEFEGTPENGFGFQGLEEMEHQLREMQEKGDLTLTTPENWTIFDNIYLNSIYLGNDLVVTTQPEIGDNLLGNLLMPGLIKRPPGFRRRWENNI